MTARVVLVDDHAIIREGLRHLLASNSSLTVVGEAGTGRECLAMVEQWRPDVVVMDIAMPDLNGIETTRQLHERWPGIKVVILSVHSTREHIYQAFAAGAAGYVLKEAVGRELVEAISTAQANRRYLSRKARETGMAVEYLAAASSPLAGLSKREREVLQLVVEGRTSAFIAEQLALSPKTVETYRSRLMQKLGVSDITGLVKFAIQHGLTTLS